MRTFGLSLLVFLPMAAVGTQIHEWGHYGAALALGWSPELHHGSVSFGAPRVAGAYGTEGERLIATAMGPLTNMAIGTLGLGALWLRRRDRAGESLDVGDWLATVAALFWSRQLFNLLQLLVVAGLGSGGTGGDEARIARALGLPYWGLDAVGGGLAAVVCLRVLAWMPRPVWFSAGAATGSLVGFALWFGWLGPVLLP